MGDEENVDKEDIRKSSSFVLDNVFQNKEEMKEELEKFQKDIDEEFDDIEERIFVQNIISYLQWRLEERENAFKSLNIVEELQKKPHFVTQCNKILFYTASGKHYLSNKLSNELKNNDHFKQTRTKSQATAEIGYCLSRLGPKHHDRAVKLFKEAIANTKPERNILWEFRLALTLRRQTHMFQMTEHESFKPAEKKKEAAHLLYEIVKFPTHDHPYIKARAWCELSKILSWRNNLFEIIHSDKEKTEKITEKWCFEEAMKLCPNYFFVLRDYGIYLRYTKNLEKSKDLLERAVQLKDTICSRHHLALTLKKIVEEATPRPSLGKKNKYPYSMDRDQSKPESCAFNESSMSKEFGSLSIDPGQRVGNLFKDESDRFKSSYTSLLIKKSKSKDYIRARDLEKPLCHDHAGASVLKGTFISAKKSPRIVCVSPNNPLLLQAVDNLQKAIDMSKEYDGTQYDLGLIYRMLDRPDMALKCFSFITSRSDNCGKPSQYLMYAINAYEQQSFCKLDLLAKETDPERKEELRFDAKKCAWKAVTIVSGVLKAIPMLKSKNQCYPTLKELLQNEDSSLQTFQELAKLHDLLDYDEESIKFYQQIIELECNATNVRNLAKNCIKVKKFEKAIFTLSLFQRTPEVNISDIVLYADTCIKGAMNSLMDDNDLEMANIRFSEAYKTIFCHQNVSSPRNEEDEIAFDILVLHSCCEDDCCYQNFVTSSLKTFVKSNFTVNDIDCPPPCRRFEYLIEAMCRSQCILIIHHESKSDAGEKDEFIDRAMEIACVKHQAKILQIRKQEVEQYSPGCKEIVLTCGSSDIANKDSNQILLKGNLFSDMLCKLSEMFLKESVDLKDCNRF